MLLCSLSPSYHSFTDDIFTALENGVDVFDGSCVYTATERGSAVIFPVAQPTQASSLQQLESGKGEDRSRETSEMKDVHVLQLEINLNEEK